MVCNLDFVWERIQTIAPFADHALVASIILRETFSKLPQLYESDLTQAARFISHLYVVVLPRAEVLGLSRTMEGTHLDIVFR